MSDTYTCSECNCEIHHVFSHIQRSFEEGLDGKDSIQFKDVLPIKFYSGYGMYFDDLDEFMGKDHLFLLCSTCTDKMLDAIPNIKKLIDSRR